MKNTIKFDIECGATTCSNENGKLCRFIGTKYFGRAFYCSMFVPWGWLVPKKLEKDKDGNPKRWPECIDAEIETYD